MEKNTDSRRSGSSRRAFLSASAATAVAAAPLVTGTAAQAASSAADAAPLRGREPDPALRALLGRVDPERMRATVQRLTEFGTRHTSSSQTDPERGIGAATEWVLGQLQAIA